MDPVGAPKGIRVENKCRRHEAGGTVGVGHGVCVQCNEVLCHTRPARWCMYCRALFVVARLETPHSLMKVWASTYKESLRAWLLGAVPYRLDYTCLSVGSVCVHENYTHAPPKSSTSSGSCGITREWCTPETESEPR